MAGTRRGFNQYQGRKLYFTGEAISAQELYRLNVAESVVSPEQLLPEAMAFA